MSGAADDAPQTDESDAENFNVHDADELSEDSAEEDGGGSDDGVEDGCQRQQCNKWPWQCKCATKGA